MWLRQSTHKEQPRHQEAAPNTPSDGRRRAHGGPEPAPEHDARASQIKGCGTADAVPPQVVRFPDHRRQFECRLRVQLAERRGPETGNRTAAAAQRCRVNLMAAAGPARPLMMMNPRSPRRNEVRHRASSRASGGPNLPLMMIRVISPRIPHGSNQDLEFLAAQEAALEKAGGAAVEQGHKLQHYCRSQAASSVVEVTEQAGLARLPGRHRVMYHAF